MNYLGDMEGGKAGRWSSNARETPLLWALRTQSKYSGLEG